MPNFSSSDRLRALAVLLTLVAFGGAAVPAAAAGGPERFALATDDLHFAAGEVCNFPVSQEVIVNREYGLLFPVANDGSQLLLVTGYLLLREVNEDTGATIVLNASGPGKLTFKADGSFETVGAGPSTFWLLATDADGPGLIRTTGHVVLRIEADGTESLAVFPQHSTDLCAALAA